MKKIFLFVYIQMSILRFCLFFFFVFCCCCCCSGAVAVGGDGDGGIPTGKLIAVEQRQQQQSLVSPSPTTLGSPILHIPLTCSPFLETTEKTDMSRKNHSFVKFDFLLSSSSALLLFLFLFLLFSAPYVTSVSAPTDSTKYEVDSYITVIARRNCLVFLSIKR